MPKAKGTAEKKELKTRCVARKKEKPPLKGILIDWALLPESSEKEKKSCFDLG